MKQGKWTNENESIEMNQYKGEMYEMSGKNCESCMYYTYDEDYECYVCDMDLDEDEMIRFLRGDSGVCSLYQFADEYKIVRKQM